MTFQARTIAVIDDDPRVLESLISLLASHGYAARSYMSAEQFLQTDGPTKSSCVVADIEMQQMSGLALLEYLKNSNCDIPVILITGKRSLQPESFYRECGAVGFFRKPVDGDALVELLRSECTGTKHEAR
jgi:FixJ family two-component response regulator